MVHAANSTASNQRHIGQSTPLFRYRTLMYISIFFSGAVALVFQIVWQKYLSFLVGSEARSISLVIAVFLLGLASGYRFWGNLTERSFSRSMILKIVGYIELGIAGYAIIFASLFTIVRDISYAAPDWLVVDLAVTAALIFLPTFLMGASIPLLTAGIPDHVDEVNYCHSRVYGINTLGAFAGAFAGGFFLVPSFGLPMSLLLGAVLNIAIALVFIFNRVDGPMHKAEEMPSIPNNFGAMGIYMFVFVTGAVSIAYEVLFIRILGLTIGSGHYVFPIVVGVVILGLAIGSLSLRRGSVTAGRVFKELTTLVVLLTVLYFTVPLWPYWISHVRVSLATIPSNYGVFLFVVVMFVAMMLLPVVIPMGRLLPIGYSLIDKTSRDYGKMCGRVYFTNTAGTVFGAIGLGYAMFHLLDLESIFKLNLALVLALMSFLLVRHGNPRQAVVCALLAAAVFLLPSWNREHHRLGMFRFVTADSVHFRNPLHPPQLLEGPLLFLRDDPSVTVSVNEVPMTNRNTGVVTQTRSIMVNGKSDGNTMSDYSNMMLTGLLPYLHAPMEADMDAVVIGLGTGMTSGMLAAVDDIRSVTTLEISSAVIEASPLFDEDTFNLSQNPKSEIVQVDAFRYFARARRSYDLVVSEPSNPWVVGVENLFTPEYYRLVSRVMSEGGVFFQWIQVYEMNSDIFSAIMRNLINEFEHVRLYIIGDGDVGVLASHQPITDHHLQRRLAEPVVQEALAPMELSDEGPLKLIELYHTEQLRMIGLRNASAVHSLDFPWLGHRAGRARFLNQRVAVGALLPHEIARHLPSPAEDRDAILQWIAEHYEQWQPRCGPNLGHSANFVCETVSLTVDYLTRLAAPHSAENLLSQLEAYNGLRARQLVPEDEAFLDSFNQFLIDARDDIPPDERRQAAQLLVREHGYEWQWNRAREVADQLRQAGILNTAEHQHVMNQVNASREIAQGLQMLREAWRPN